MATTTYISMTSPISAVAGNCPTLTIADAIRATVIDLCERGQVWKYTHPDIALTSGIYSYSFVPPDNDTVISMVESARINDLPIDITEPRNAIQSFPTFPDTTNLGPPTALWQMSQRAFLLAPTPDTAITYTLKLNVTLKPLVTSTGSDTTMMQEHLETINHGTLHRLLLQQKREWFNADLAGYHGKQYSYKLNMFKAIANRGYTQTSIGIAMRPFA